jgi:hypothetical protein
MSGYEFVFIVLTVMVLALAGLWLQTMADKDIDASLNDGVTKPNNPFELPRLLQQRNLSMSESNSSVICPGQRNLMSGAGDHYLRAMFTVYWNGSNTSAEPFYLHQHPFQLSLTGITTLENEVFALLQQHYWINTPFSAVYLGYEGITMTPDEVTSVAWRLLQK